MIEMKTTFSSLRSLEPYIFASCSGRLVACQCCPGPQILHSNISFLVRIHLALSFIHFFGTHILVTMFLFISQLVTSRKHVHQVSPPILCVCYRALYQEKKIASAEIAPAANVPTALFMTGLIPDRRLAPLSSACTLPDTIAGLHETSVKSGHSCSLSLSEKHLEYATNSSFSRQSFDDSWARQQEEAV